MKKWLYYIPVFFALFIVLFVNGIPFVNTIVSSFTNWNGIYEQNFVGLSNYKNILSSHLFWQLLNNTLIILTYLPITMLIALIMACALNNHPKFRHIYLYIIYIPQVLSTIVVGKSFNLLFGFDGFINSVLGFFNIPKIDFLGDEKFAIIVTIISVIWFEVGWQVLMITSRLTTVDKNIPDLIKIEGIGFFKSVFLIYLPIIYETYVYTGLISLFFAFSGLFPIVYILTKGGPGYATTTIDYMIYVLSFGGNNREIGEASALAVLLLFTAILSVLLYLFVMWGIRKFLSLFYHTHVKILTDDVF